MTTIPENQSTKNSVCTDYNENNDLHQVNENALSSSDGGDSLESNNSDSSLIIFVKGLLMGSADAVPGVSGGTIALITGIYERLITSISHFNLTFLKHLCSFQIRKALKYVDFRFIAVLLCGIVVALLAVASSMKFLLENHRMYVLAVFFGLIAASSVLVVKKIHLHKPLNWVMLIAGALFAWWLVGQPFMAEAKNPSLPVLFLCGMVAICAMILPGISGSYVLLILGKYTFMIGVIEKLVKQGFRGQLPLDEFTSCVVILAVFACGCGIGLLGFSQLLRFLLARWEQSTLAILCGFMVGSLRSLWPFQEKHELADKVIQYTNCLPGSCNQAITIAAVALGSMLFLLLIEWIASKAKKNASN